VADKPDSQDLCFIGSEGYRSFLSKLDMRLIESGPILDPEGKYLGEHSGLFGYTIGQRKGIGLSMTEPYYVLSKDVTTNTLTVGPRDSLGRSSFVVKNPNWVSGRSPQETDRINVQVRYKAREVVARIKPLANGSITVDLNRPLPDVTPGQTAVFYRGEICLGGGIIQT
jgi:tRNA-specific 2-thiouridylase